MTELLCHRDSYLKEFEAPRSGGQRRGAGGGPGPHGVLSRRRGPALRPGLAEAGSPCIAHGAPGRRGLALAGRRASRCAAAPCTGKLDWDLRYRLMRTHTAFHILCGVVWRDWKAQVTGGNMEPLKGRMDFEFETLQHELVAEIEKRDQRRGGGSAPVSGAGPPPGGGIPDPRPDPHQDQPASGGHPRGPHRRDPGPGPAGRRRHARGEHQRGGQRSGWPATRARAGSTSASSWKSGTESHQRVGGGFKPVMAPAYGSGTSGRARDRHRRAAKPPRDHRPHRA